MKIAIVHGPNLNLLGKREPHIYGSTNFADYLKVLEQRFPDAQISFFQSNAEGALIDHLQTIGFEVNGIILNAGAYSHTSYAIADAISSITAHVLEVHISNTFSREDFRHGDVLAGRCVGLIAGLGLAGYDAALQWFRQKSDI